MLYFLLIIYMIIKLLCNVCYKKKLSISCSVIKLNCNVEAFCKTLKGIVNGFALADSFIYLLFQK